MADSGVVAVAGDPGAGRTGVIVGSWPTGMPKDWRYYPRVARQIESAGFDLLFVGDHLFPTGENPDALALLSGFAVCTERVVLGTGILLLPLRDPVIVAKQAATVDVLSGGRVILGVGVGGEFAWEWNAMGIPREGRGRRLDEYIDVVQQLWTGEEMHHPGPLRPVEGVRGTPAPVQPGGPPIWVGGRSDAALARAARHQGWCAYAVSARRARASVEKIRELRGGDMANFRVSLVLFTCVGKDDATARATATEQLGHRYKQDFDHMIDTLGAVGSVERIRERVAEYREAGVDDIIFGPQVPHDQFDAQIEMLSELVG